MYSRKFYANKPVYLTGSVGEEAENVRRDVQTVRIGLNIADEVPIENDFNGAVLPFITNNLDRSIRKFQKKSGLKVDGMILPGGETQASLNKKIEGHPNGFSLPPSFEVGLQNPVGEGKENNEVDVKRLKFSLGALGYIPEPPLGGHNGVFDQKFSNAIGKFQMDNNLKSDGLVNPDGDTENGLRKKVKALLKDLNNSYEKNVINAHSRIKTARNLMNLKTPAPDDAQVMKKEHFSNAVRSPKWATQGAGKPHRRGAGSIRTSFKNGRLNGIHKMEKAESFFRDLRYTTPTSEDFEASQKLFPPDSGSRQTHHKVARFWVDSSAFGAPGFENPHSAKESLSRAVDFGVVTSAVLGKISNEVDAVKSVRIASETLAPNSNAVREFLVSAATSSSLNRRAKQNAIGFLGVYESARRKAATLGGDDPDRVASRELVNFLGYVGRNTVWDIALPSTVDQGNEGGVAVILVAGRKGAKPRGMNNPASRDALQYGRKEHQNFKTRHGPKEQKVYNNGKSWRIDREIEREKGGPRIRKRPDAVSPRGYGMEFKPRTPTGRKNGEAQCREFTRITGKKCRVIYYDPPKNSKPKAGAPPRNIPGQSGGVPEVSRGRAVGGNPFGPRIKGVPLPRVGGLNN